MNFEWTDEANKFVMCCFVFIFENIYVTYSKPSFFQFNELVEI